MPVGVNFGTSVASTTLTFTGNLIAAKYSAACRASSGVSAWAIAFISQALALFLSALFRFPLLKSAIWFRK